VPLKQSSLWDPCSFQKWHSW